MNSAKFLRTLCLHNTSERLLLVLFVACFLYFPLSKIFAPKKVASCEKGRLVENRLKDNAEIEVSTKYEMHRQYSLPVHNSKGSGFLEESGGKKVGW